MIKIQPATKIVVLKPVKIEELGGSLLVVFASEKEQPLVGEVVVVGSGKVPMVMKKGNKVAYRRFGESKFLLGGNEYIFVHFDDLLGVIKK